MRKLRIVLLRGLLLFLGLAAAAFGVLVLRVDGLGREDQARAADVIVVLGARVNADGRPGSDLTSRTFHAVDLWMAGYAPNIICTGGFRNEPLAAAAVCKRFAVELGVPADRVFLADGSTNTAEDAQMTAQVMDTYGWETAILVSHPLHLYRARWLFRRAGIDAVTSPTTTDTGRIFLPLRMWYAAREASGIVLTSTGLWDLLPEEWIARIQQWSYGGL